MMMRIQFQNGRSEEAILLAATGNAVRVAIRDCDDSTEFRLQGGEWVSESDVPVRIEVWPDGGVRPAAVPLPVWIQ